MSGTSLATAVRPLWRLLEARGIDPGLLFREVGLDTTLMDESRGRFPLNHTLAAWTRAAELIPDPCFGLEAAKHWHPGDFHALGCAFGASSTLHSALRRLCRYVTVLHDAIDLEVNERGEEVELAGVGKFYKERMVVAAADAVWAIIMDICRINYPGVLDPIRVSLTRPEPACASAFLEFYRCPVSFGAAVPGLVFPRSVLDRPLTARNREIARNNDLVLSAFLATLRQDDLLSRVKVALIEELPSGKPTDDSVASALFMSARTLQRRLAAEGTSFSQLLEVVRRELAEGYIADASLPISEIGFLLGFSEVSGFSRAFKRWTGASPTAYRGRSG